MWEICANWLLPKALKSCPESNMVTLPIRSRFWIKLLLSDLVSSLASGNFSNIYDQNISRDWLRPINCPKFSLHYWEKHLGWSGSVFIKMGQSQPLFLYFGLFFNTFDIKLNLPMTGSELPISGFGSDRPNNWVTTTAHVFTTNIGNSQEHQVESTKVQSVHHHHHSK